MIATLYRLAKEGDEFVKIGRGKYSLIEWENPDDQDD